MMFHDDSRLPTIVYHLGIGMIKPHSFDVELGKAFRHPTKNTHLSKVTSSLFGTNANRHFIWLAFFLSISTKLCLPQNSASPSCSSHIYKQLEVGEHRNKKRKHRNLYRGKCHVNSLMREEKTAAVAWAFRTKKNSTHTTAVHKK